MQGGDFDKDENITFHNIDEFLITPKLTPEEARERFSKGDLETIKNYGLRVVGYEEPKVIEIRYNYFGVPLSLKVDVELK